MRERIASVRQGALHVLQDLRTAQDLEEKERSFLGRKGQVQGLFDCLVELSLEEKREAGPLLNGLKKELEELFAQKRQSFSSGEVRKVDVTMLQKRPLRGSLHPVTVVVNDLHDIFTSMGFRYFDAPIIDTDYYNFEALNIPPHHPARDMQDTFYISDPAFAKALAGRQRTANGEQRTAISEQKEASRSQKSVVSGQEKDESDESYVLRTHVSNTQNRILREVGMPIRCFYHGKVFRNEATDASHDYEFHQFEVMMVDKGVSLAHLKFVTQSFLNALFRREVKTRFRPGYFPFVEPGLELDFSCLLCDGAGCRVCKHMGWVEFLGCGMVHPNVLREGGVDPSQYTGFAFGCGLTRLVMMRYKIEDIRLLHSADLRFLEQFR